MPEKEVLFEEQSSQEPGTLRIKFDHIKVDGKSHFMSDMDRTSGISAKKIHAL